ncbi:hypothetical protein VKT23_004910 [Stygiomarasmius scandens]|uniref:Cytochrome P450 n=1 Tax=Marasmiellus scandens TaxID=2682957 RepID=A0ABR1JUV9_9AGAR
MIDNTGAWTIGSTHQRHRKALNPAFSASQLRTFLSLFQISTQRLVDKWHDVLINGQQEQVLNVSKWLPRITLDVVGESAFDYKFGALDEDENPLSSTLKHLFDDTLAITKTDMFFRALRRNLPFDPLYYHPLKKDAPLILTKEDRRFNHWLEMTQGSARTILKDKADSSRAVESGSKDILSVLVRSNALEDPSKRLDEEEVLSQMATIILAGHETTASTITWILYELARHPDHQHRVREELDQIKKQKVEAGEDEAFTSHDYDSMPFFNATIKEVLRLYPISITLFRCAGRDDIIPLSEPIISASGRQLTEIPIKEGQRIHINISSYNHLRSIWGEDAGDWNPERFLDIKKGLTLGVYANLMTFGAGIRSCIGWRFALQEMQAIVAGLISNFEFSIDPNIEIYKGNFGLMAPVVRGKEVEGSQMPLKVKIRG